MYRRLVIIAGLAAGLACATGGRPKGGLEPVSGLSAGAVDQALKPRRLALLVGINAFSDERWPALKHAKQDAESLGEVFQDPKRGRFDRVRVLAGDGVGRAEVLSALDELASGNTSAQDTVVVYFSTHGTLARGPDGELSRYLVTTDTRQVRIRETALRVRDILATFDGLASQRKVMVLAACHSGSGKSALPAPIKDELAGIKGAFFVRPLEEMSQASIVLSASAWGETAREDDVLAHDIYTHFLLEALEGQDEDGDGAVTATEAHAYAMHKTYYFSKGRQRPQVESTVLGADPVVLTGERTQPADPVLFSFLPRFEGMRVEVDGRAKGTLPDRLVLRPGSYRVTVRAGEGADPILDTQIDLSEGDRLAIETLVERSQPHWHVSAFGGYQWFLDESTRSTLVAPAFMFGISVSRLDWPTSNLETGLDFTLGGGNQTVAEGGASLTQGLLEISYAIKMVYRFDVGPVSLLVGPRIAAVHVLRNDVTPVPEPGVSPGPTSDEVFSDHFMNVSPGLIAGLRWKLSEELTLDVEVRVHFYTVHDEEDRTSDHGYLDVFGGIGWSF